MLDYEAFQTLYMNWIFQSLSIFWFFLGVAKMIFLEYI